MILTNLKVINFRNYESLNINLSDKINIFYGKNAQGKTNILESIYVLGLTKSHRALLDESLIKEGNPSSKIEGTIRKEKMDTTLEIILEPKTKKYKIDKNPIKRTKDYISNMNIIIFYPEDLELIKGSPAVRRKFLNLELSQLYNTYYCTLSDYNKLLKIRNEYLKRMNKNITVDKNYFSILTEYLIEKSVFIYRARFKFIQKLNLISNRIFEEITGISGFKVEYRTTLNIETFQEDEIKTVLRNKFSSDEKLEIKYGSTLYGPHRDDFDFYLNTNNLKSYGSQGQQRVAVLSIKLAEIEIFKNYAHTLPILLLDDVFSELDNDKKNNLLNYINEDIQTIITTTDLKNINPSLLKRAKLFEVENGKIIKKEEVE